MVLPGTASATVAGVPLPPVLDTPTPHAPEIPHILDAPKTPPAPFETIATPTSHATNPGFIPAKAVDSQHIANPSPPPASPPRAPVSTLPPPPPPRKRHRFRNFLLSLVLLSALGYAGSVYYALVSDNFHDFFTEYVPFGEDAVAYFEERRYKKRFPGKDLAAKQWPQTRGEQKVTIGRKSGLHPQVAEENKGSDLGQSGRHTSALEENKLVGQKPPEKESVKDKADIVEGAKKVVAPAQPKAPEPKPAVPVVEKPVAAPAVVAAPVAPASTPTTVSPVDHINIPQATEPVVQDVVKMVNNIITAVNASPEASRFTSILSTLKGDLDNVIAEFTTFKDQAAHDTETKVANAHTEFDSAAKELVRRLEGEMREQESKWMEEYESERERLSEAYTQRLNAELAAAKQVAEEKAKNSLLQQEIEIQKQYSSTVKSKIEEERSGRLSKIDALASSVAELEDLTGSWNEVVDATLRTQHLQVAVQAVRQAVLDPASDVPTPFLNELVALKEVSHDDPVVAAAIASIPPIAYQRGIPSPAHLIDRFRRVATEVRKASLLPEDAGVASHAASAVLSRFMFTKKSDRGLPEGEDVEATLARTEVLLEEGDLDGAAREMNGMRGWAGVLSRDWVGEVRRVLEVRQAVEVSGFRCERTRRCLLICDTGHCYRGAAEEFARGVEGGAARAEWNFVLRDDVRV